MGILFCKEERLGLLSLTTGLLGRSQCSHPCDLTSISGRESKSCFKSLKAEATQDQVDRNKINLDWNDEFVSATFDNNIFSTYSILWDSIKMGTTILEVEQGPWGHGSPQLIYQLQGITKLLGFLRRYHSKTFKDAKVLHEEFTSFCVLLFEHHIVEHLTPPVMFIYNLVFFHQKVNSSWAAIMPNTLKNNNNKKPCRTEHMFWHWEDKCLWDWTTLGSHQILTTME